MNARQAADSALGCEFFEALKWKDEKIAAGELNVEWIVTSDRERVKMEAAAAAGMEAIYSDYADRGIQNARKIYEALNK